MEIEATLGEMGIKWKKNGQMDIMCTDEVNTPPRHASFPNASMLSVGLQDRQIVFELRIDEIGDVESGGNTHKLHLNRMQGDIWEYKQLSRQLLANCTKSLALHHITQDEAEEAS